MIIRTIIIMKVTINRNIMVVNSIIVINIDDVAVENDYVPLLCEQLPEGSNSNSSSNPINQKTLFSRG